MPASGPSVVSPVIETMDPPRPRRNQQRADRSNPALDRGERAALPAPLPGEPRRVRLGVRIGILARHQLKRQQVLSRELVAQRQRDRASRSLLVEPRAAVVVVDRLRRIGIERPRIDVGAVRQLRRIGIQKPLDDGARRGVGRQRRTLVGQRHQHVAVHAALHPVLARLQENFRSAPNRRRESEAVIVVVRRLDAAHLEKRTRAENAVPVGFEDAAVDAGAVEAGTCRMAPGGLPNSELK